MEDKISGKSRTRTVAIALIAVAVAVCVVLWMKREGSVGASVKASSEPAPTEASAVVPASQPVAPSQPSVAAETPSAKTDPGFAQAKDCASAYREKDTLDRQLKVCEDAEPYRNDPQHADFIKSCDARTLKFDGRLKIVGSSLASCAAKSSEEAELAFYQATRKAAASGDTAAQICYLRAGFYPGRPWTKEEKAGYDAEAKAYMQAAFDRGDWRVVELLRSATPKVVGQNELMAAITDADRLTIYRMNRLLRRGAEDGKYQQLLDALAQDPGAPIPAEDKKKADLWVAQTYERQFSKSPRLRAQPDTCITFGEAN